MIIFSESMAVMLILGIGFRVESQNDIESEHRAEDNHHNCQQRNSGRTEVSVRSDFQVDIRLVDFVLV